MSASSPPSSPVAEPLDKAAGAGQEQRQKVLLLSVEAIIGAGKSTLLEELAARPDMVVVREPLDLWEQDRGGETLLGRYYGDQKANAFMFETYAMLSRVKALRRAENEVTASTRCIVMERSWHSSRRCFAENSQELGHLDELEASLHRDMYDWVRRAQKLLWPSPALLVVQVAAVRH